nr:Ig-like domain-containing protein [uncultured Sphingomonas sp.]
MAEMFSTDSAWKPVKIGGGGMATGIDSNADGTIVTRTDGAGAYIWTGSVWQQLVTASSMPAAFQQAEGVYEIRIAPSSSSIMYMALAGGVYKTTDRGANWTKTNFPDVFMDANGSSRADGQRMAIDPNDPNTVFAGTQRDGLWVTRDGGMTWQKAAGVPVLATNNDAGLSGITFHGNTVYVGSDGGGVYRSDDKGVTWSRTSGGPTDIAHAAVAPDGTLFVTATNQTVWKYSNDVWIQTSVTQAHSIAIDPFDANRIVVATAGGSLQQSTDGGATWQGWAWGTKLDATGDAPWLATSGAYMSTTAIMFDPLSPDKLFQSAGVGVWHTVLTPKLGVDASGKYVDTLWHSQTAGIENIVPNDIIAPAGGDPIFASWDRPFFTEANLDDYATSYGGGKFSMGWSVDYASSDPSFIVGLSDWYGTENSGFSIDGGKTWQKFEGYPEWANNSIGGSIAASTPENFIWVTTGGRPPAYTLDGGKTWTNVTIPGLTDWTNLHVSHYLKRTVITADREQPNTFYLYDVNSGVYATHDGGVSWAKVYSGKISLWSSWNAKIEAVPGSAGELFFTNGRLQGTGDIPFMHSSDGGASWQAVNGVTEVTSFGYGAPKVAGGPATVFIIGFVNMDYGVWYSTDDAQTWTKIGEHPMGNLDALTVINGDMDHFGRVYVGFGGNSYAYYDVDGSTPTMPATPTTPAPTQYGVITTALDDVGGLSTVGNGALINDSTPTLSGTLSALLGSGQKLAIYRNGELIGQVSPTTTSWSFTDPGASNGKHDYVVKVVDSLGQSGAASGSFSLSIDTVAPTQAVNVTSADLTSSTSLRTTSAASSANGGTTVTGTIAGTLAADETVVVFRDGGRIGTASVSNGSWSFNDGVTFGSFKYTAQVQDAAGNLGQMSSVLAVTLGTNVIEGTHRNDVLIGTSGADIISGVGTGPKLGKGTIDTLTGGAGNDVFVLGDARGRFYDDGSNRSSGTNDFARITDFGVGDQLQLRGSASEYLQGWINNLQGFSGTGIYHDTNGNGVLDNRDELIALVQNYGPVDFSGFIFI